MVYVLTLPEWMVLVTISYNKVEYISRKISNMDNLTIQYLFIGYIKVTYTKFPFKYGTVVTNFIDIITLLQI